MSHSTPLRAAREAPTRQRRVGVTGHSNLTAASVGLVEHTLRTALSGRGLGATLRGVSCLAAGADRAFARVVLQLGGTLEVILPAQDYRERHVDSADLAEFDQLLAAASTVHTLGFDRACRHAYVAANETMLTAVDEVLAVWDGHPASVMGSTADVVTEAHHRRLPVTILWPSGAARTEPASSRS